MRFPRITRTLVFSLPCIFLSAAMTAQVKTETSTTQHQPSVETKVERGEVVYVSGNDLVVKMEDGQVRNFPNVPESARVTVDGQQLSIHELKPGMKLQRTITTTTTPQTVKTVQTVTGTVVQVMAPSSVTLRLEDGNVQRFKIPAGQKFTVDGQETDASGLRKGMRISATRIVTAPENVVTRESNVTGEKPAMPTEALQGPVLIEAPAKPPVEVAKAEPAPAQPAAETKPKELPQTASPLPFIALCGAVVLVAGIAAARERRRGAARM